MTPDQALQRLQAAEVQILPLAKLLTDDALQPREAFRDQGRVEQRSEEHVGHMRLALEASEGYELEPLLVARVDGLLYVVDGHHRLKAYRRAKRGAIPVRVEPMTRPRAVILSKLVNCEGRALEMHAEQRRDAAWQYLAAVTTRGAKGLPEGESLRTIAGRFGVGKDTVRAMLQHLPRVNPKDHDGHLDAGTGWPRWHRIRRGPAEEWQQELEEMDVEQITQHEAEQLAKKIGALMERATPEAARRALLMLEIEAQLEAVNPDRLSFARETAEEADF